MKRSNSVISDHVLKGEINMATLGPINTSRCGAADKTTIDKVCKWLRWEVDYYVNSDEEIDRDGLIKDFRKEIEDYV